MTLVLDRQVDVARGDVLAHRDFPPVVARRVVARLTWLDREPLEAGKRYWLKHAGAGVHGRGRCRRRIAGAPVR